MASLGLPSGGRGRRSALARARRHPTFSRGSHRPVSLFGLATRRPRARARGWAPHVSSGGVPAPLGLLNRRRGICRSTREPCVTRSPRTAPHSSTSCLSSPAYRRESCVTRCASLWLPERSPVILSSRCDSSLGGGPFHPIFATAHQTRLAGFQPACLPRSDP